MNDDEHSLFLVLQLVTVTYSVWNKTPESIFQITRASEVLNKYAMGLWSDNFTAAFFASFIVTVFVPDSAVAAQLVLPNAYRGPPMVMSEEIFRHYGISRGQMAFTTKYPNFCFFISLFF